MFYSITTGVDVPIFQNVVFFKCGKSQIAFQKLLVRVSRIPPN
ncbi:hypothetical protein CSE_02640 [Caldisericum exile AZM16c01]|uniref:Uncharacterized protein n=1 Tax=Caldisericum exile (strain DSM 21853 / NBRC 104410 / AZM16c01) TaxID=511051 RepID=A0A7U6JFP1_CALEA|nr:hypothetical protein CSE_02640 [Caldisericum exile AZM16c01]